MNDAPFVLGVDLDGVCADYTAGFREVVAAERGVDPESLPLVREWGFESWGFELGEFERYHQIAVVERRMLADLPVMDGAAEVLWRLSDAGVWIRIITHRLYTNWGHVEAAGDTVAWLDRESIPYRDLCFVGGKTAVDADAYVEDSPINVEALRSEGRTVIVFDQSYNQEFEDPRATDWAEVEALVNVMLAERPQGLQQQLPGLDAGADRLQRSKGTRALHPGQIG